MKKSGRDILRNRKKVRTAIVNKPSSKAHGKKVFINSFKGRLYKCSFDEKLTSKIYTFWKSELKFEKQKEDESESN